MVDVLNMVVNVVVVKMVGEDEHEGGGVSSGGCIKHGAECGGGEDEDGGSRRTWF